MPYVYHDLQLIQIRMPRTGSTALKNLLTRASDDWIGPDNLSDVDGQHWPIQTSMFWESNNYRVWATERKFGPWKRSIQRVRQGLPPTFGLFPEWPGLVESFHSMKRSGDEYYDAYCFLRKHLVEPAGATIPTEALPTLDHRTGRMGPREVSSSEE
jgi:hypothetical protein